ncbi:hypothetical protein LCGC14_1562680 [marine sediment metagenome]|uniref:Uncharacterized protein n=1 Tax=marine sediment metagenome TaxID=412755 RepID=A0A0F9IM16_9ZZZZ
MIENLWILTKGGVLLFSKNYVKLSKPDDLLAGFFTAVDIFIREITKEEIKNISMKDHKFNYIIGDDLIIVISTNEYDNDILIQNLLKEVKIIFLEKYIEELKFFSGDTIRFKNFDEDLGVLIKDLDVSIKCQTCKKIVVGEFRYKNIANHKIYFCCTSCEKYFSYDN